MNDIELKTIAIDGKARLNEVTVNGKQFQTPLFMPVATRGALKSLPFNYLEHTDIILANTYHLFLRPGLDVIQEFDGLHKFIGWNKVDFNKNFFGSDEECHLLQNKAYYFVHSFLSFFQSLLNSEV